MNTSTWNIALHQHAKESKDNTEVFLLQLNKRNVFLRLLCKTKLQIQFVLGYEKNNYDRFNDILEQDKIILNWVSTNNKCCNVYNHQYRPIQLWIDSSYATLIVLVYIQGNVKFNIKKFKRQFVNAYFLLQRDVLEQTTRKFSNNNNAVHLIAHKNWWLL